MAVDPKALGLGLGTNKIVELVADQFDAAEATAVQLIADQFDAAVQKIEGESAFSVTDATPTFTLASTADTAAIVNYLAALTAALQTAGVL